MEALRAQELGNDDIDEIVQLLWQLGSRSDERLMRDIECYSDIQALMGIFASMGFKGFSALRIATAIQTIRGRSRRPTLERSTLRYLLFLPTRIQ